MKSGNFYFIILFLSISFSCTENDDGTDSPLPAITSEGKNTFGCKINGETFVPRDNGGFSAGYTTVLKAQYAYYEHAYYGLEPGYHLAIGAYNSLTNKDIRIELSASDAPLTTGVSYPLTMNNEGNISAEYSYSWETPHPDHPGVYIYHSTNYKTTQEQGGEIKFLKIDETNQIISGVFSFDCINPENNEVVQIKDGRFDIVYERSF